MSPTHTGVTAQPADLDPCGHEDHPDCGIRDVQNRIGDKWSVLVIVELASGPRRFRELQRAIDGISQRMLTLTMRRLERDGLVLRTVYPTVPAQVDYRLTQTGASLTHLVEALAHWSLAHRPVIAEARRQYDQAHPDHDIR
jgi:DNA-binding HxlR family transcriptional regulator